MAATMQDVARLAGVSVKTVSNVVNEFPHVRDETRARVTAAIAELGYQVNLTARGLRRGRTGLIGLAVPELKLPYFAELADSIIDEAEKVGHTVLIEQTDADAGRERDVLLGERRALTDGLLFSPLGMDAADLAALTIGYPMVLLGERIFDSGFDHVTMNNVECARAATMHLVERGRRHIAFLGHHPGELVGTAALRLEGYQQALAEAGLPADPALVVESGEWHRDTGYAATSRLIEQGTDVDAIFAANDSLAIGALHALHAHSVVVPEQVAIIGFDDVEEASYTSPPLTSVSAGRAEIAREAIRLLVSRIDEAAAGGPRSPAQLVLADYEIKVRESSGQLISVE